VTLPVVVAFCLAAVALPSTLAQTAGTAAAQQQTIRVNAVRVEGNTLLPEPAIAALVTGVAGSERNMSELNQLAARIQSAYRDAGYGGVVAYLPEQQISSGNVVIQVVEGKLANVRITGNRHFDSANIRAGLPSLREGVTPVVRSIDRDLQLTNENPAKEVKLTLTAGARPGEIDAEIDVAETSPLQFLLGYNNFGTKATGKHRLSVGVQHSNLFGRDHIGTLQYQTSPDEPKLVSIFSAGYRVPLYAQAASLDAIFAYSDVSTATTFTPAGPLTFVGKGSILGLRANRNLDRIGEYDHRVTLGIEARKYDNVCSIGDFGPQACGPAGVSVRAVPVSLAYTGQKQGPQLSWGVNTSLSANAGGSSQETFEAARPGGKKHYVIARFSGFAEQAMAAGFAVHGRVDLQYSPNALISGEKFGVGGANNVRGYQERELAGDRGFLARVEALAPALDLTSDVRLRPYLFVDHGRVSNHKDMPCRGIAETSCKLTGAGIGSRLSIGRSATATLDIGRAFENGVTTSPGNVRGHISVSFVY
jgi:hemolysin activation/secretion protein